MAVEQPQGTDTLNSPDHAALHRIIAASTSANVQSIAVQDDSTIRMGNSAGSSYTEVEQDGTIEFIGDAVVWEDLRFPATQTTVGGTKDPDFVQFQDDGAGSQGVFTYAFSPTVEEELYFVAQMPHAWKIGTDLHPHVHWTPTNTNVGSVSWGMEYTWQSINGTFGNTTIISTSDPADGTAYKHQLTSLPTISAAGITGVSSILVCRIFRDATASLGQDDYDTDADLLEIDFHFQKDTVGSRQEFVK